MSEDRTDTLPPGWAWTTLGEVTESAVEQGGPQRDGDFLYVDISSIDNRLKRITDPKVIAASDAPSRARQRLRPEDVIVSMTRPNLNAVALLPANMTGAIGSTGFHVLRTNSVAPGWLIHLVQTEAFIDAMSRLVQGALYPAVRPKDVRSYSIPIAPLPEQHRIVAEIEKHFTRLEASVAELERARVNLKRYRAAVLKAACEGRLVPTEAQLAHAEGREYEPADQLLERILRERRAKWETDQLAKMRAAGKEPQDDNWKAKYEEPGPPETEGLPELPEGWAWTAVGQLSQVGTGATPLRSNSAFYGGSIPWVTSGALNSPFIDHAEEFITELALSETNTKIFPRGSLLVAMYGEGKTRGKVSELRIEAATNQACAALVFDQVASACRPFIKLFLMKNYDDIRRESSGGVQPNLNLSIVRNTAVPLPPLDEQRRIVPDVERRLSVVDELDTTADQSLKRAGRLRQAVLKRAFEGRLVPQEPNDEPASELLKRTRAERAALADAQNSRRERRTPGERSRQKTADSLSAHQTGAAQ